MIAEKVWGYGFESYSNAIDVHVNRLRKKVDCLFYMNHELPPNTTFGGPRERGNDVFAPRHAKVRGNYVQGERRLVPAQGGGALKTSSLR
jgi:hypothetical protein